MITVKMIDVQRYDIVEKVLNATFNKPYPAVSLDNYYEQKGEVKMTFFIELKK